MSDFRFRLEASPDSVNGIRTELQALMAVVERQEHIIKQNSSLLNLVAQVIETNNELFGLLNQIAKSAQAKQEPSLS